MIGSKTMQIGRRRVGYVALLLCALVAAIAPGAASAETSRVLTIPYPGISSYSPEIASTAGWIYFTALTSRGVQLRAAGPEGQLRSLAWRREMEDTDECQLLREFDLEASETAVLATVTGNWHCVDGSAWNAARELVAGAPGEPMRLVARCVLPGAAVDDRLIAYAACARRGRIKVTIARVERDAIVPVATRTVDKTLNRGAAISEPFLAVNGNRAIKLFDLRGSSSRTLTVPRYVSAIDLHVDAAGAVSLLSDDDELLHWTPGAATPSRVPVPTGKVAFRFHADKALFRRDFTFGATPPPNPDLVEAVDLATGTISPFANIGDEYSDQYHADRVYWWRDGCWDTYIWSRPLLEPTAAAPAPCPIAIPDNAVQLRGRTLSARVHCPEGFIGLFVTVRSPALRGVDLINEASAYCPPGKSGVVRERLSKRVAARLRAASGEVRIGAGRYPSSDDEDFVSRPLTVR